MKGKGTKETMNLVLGASGQIGSAIVENLAAANAPVTAIVHSAEKINDAKAKGAARVVVADSFDLPALKAAFQDGTTVFVLTPETGKSNDVIGETRAILANYRTAIEATPTITKIVGLSSMGAQYPVGNLEMSYLLERAFDGLKNVQRVFVRPAYYFSNWLPYLPTAKAQGILPTFYPVDLAMPMTAPREVAAFIAERMVKPVEGDGPIYELEGPAWYSSRDVAEAMGNVLKRAVRAEQIPREKWANHLKQIDFTNDAVQNFIAMTELVCEGKAKPEGKGTLPAKTTTTLSEFMAQNAG